MATTVLERRREAIRLEMKETADAAAKIRDGAAEEERELTPDERSEIEIQLKKVDELEVKEQEADEQIKLEQRIRTIGEGLKSAEPANGNGQRPSGFVIPKGAKSLGEQFTDSEGYKALKAGGLMASKWSSGEIEIQGKATLTQDPASGGVWTQPQLVPGVVETLFQRLTVADLMAPGTTTSTVVRYLRESTATSGAAPTAEGAAKPESTLAFDQVDEPVRKIATFLPVTDEMIEDTPQIQSFINGRLSLFVQQAEEAQLLDGTGTAPALQGLLRRTGIQTQAIGTDKASVAILKAANKVRDTFLEPDAVVLNPADYTTVRTEADSNGQFFGGGPFYGPYGGPQGGGGYMIDFIWGLRIVVTKAMAAGTGLVGAFGTATQVYRRGGLTVEASNSHADFFQKDITAIRAFERLALAVYRPAAFCKVTFA